MAKFGRNYSLQVGTASGDLITITPPFTLMFDITRDYYSSANIAKITIYNLSKDNRNAIRKDVSSLTEFRPIILKAGYGQDVTKLPIILKGNVTQGSSQRQGTDFITEINCFDAGFAFANSFTDTQYIANTPQESIIRDRISSLKGVDVSLGAISDSFDGNIARGNAYCGSTTEILKELTGGAFFIDNGVAHVIGDNEYIESEDLIISPATGLLNTPMLEQTIVHLDVLFEPRLKLCQRVMLQSATGSSEATNSTTVQNLKTGKYRVVSIHHKGTISEAMCGEAITTVGLDSQAYIAVQLAAQNG